MRRPALTASNVSLKSPSPCSMDLIPMVRVLGIAALGRLFHVRHEIRDETSDVAERIRLFEPLHVTVMPLRRGRDLPNRQIHDIAPFVGELFPKYERRPGQLRSPINIWYVRPHINVAIWCSTRQCRGAGLTQPDRLRDLFQVERRVAAVEARGVDALVEHVQGVLLAVADGAEDLVRAPRDGQAGLARVG